MAEEQDKPTKSNLESPHPNPKKKVQPKFDSTPKPATKRKRHRLYL